MRSTAELILPILEACSLLASAAYNESNLKNSMNAMGFKNPYMNFPGETLADTVGFAIGKRNKKTHFANYVIISRYKIKFKRTEVYSC